MEGSEIMKQAKTIFMVLIMILICCSYSIGQSSSGIGIKGNIGAAPLGIINNGASVYPIGGYGASIYPVGATNNGAKAILLADMELAFILLAQSIMVLTLHCRCGNFSAI